MSDVGSGTEGQERSNGRQSVLAVVKEYPQISQTYIKAEIEAVENEFDITVVTRRGPDVPYERHRPYRQAERTEEIREIAEDLRPDVLHTHYLVELPFIGPLAEATSTPFTVRTHSFDTLALRTKSFKSRLKQRLKRTSPLEHSERFQEGLRWMRSDLCLGVLAFPFSRPWLERVGAPGDKIIDCWPVVAVGRFYDRAPNGEDIMNTGVATPKKKMDDFLRLSMQVPEKRFNLYAMGYHIDELVAKNSEMGGAVNFVKPIEPDDMPAEYKKHQWLVYTADFEIPTVGWPMAVAEAQASGVGVCMPRIRPDLAQYVGDGGILYDSIDDVASIITRPVPDEMREAGFRHARRSDIDEHKHLLTDLWESIRQPASR